MNASPRRAAVEILNRVDTTGAFAEPLLDEVLSGRLFTEPADRALLTQIVYGTLRMRGYLDWVIRSLCEKRSPAVSTTARNILRTALYQIHFTDRIPDYAAVNEAVGIAKKLDPRTVPFVNGLLRNAVRRKDEVPLPSGTKDPARRVSIVHSHPLWLVKQWIRSYGLEETVDLCRAGNEIPPLAARVNALKASRREVREELAAEGIEAADAPWSLDGIILSHTGRSARELSCWKAGRITIQDEASQLVARLLYARPGDRILDLCAGTGGKATHLAERTGDGASIVAMDSSPAKLRELEKNAARLGIRSIRTQPVDATAELGEHFHNSFQSVLVDAPCSGLGTLRRNPEIKWRIGVSDVPPLSVLQSRLMDRGARCVSPGGTLVYSTCTLLKQENEDVVADFLRRHGDFQQVREIHEIPKELLDMNGFFRTLPHRHGTDGFFAAVLRKATR
ncbi:MAG: 16S rRNA (cytosine(967)-C(5))-methyltransferase RsmB [Syntrophaceae bacterium]|nr:16S rRNA (cytosine(967)-C(5))-methyltransferase RsmB [Syntrophaceae bacterium]